MIKKIFDQSPTRVTSVRVSHTMRVNKSKPQKPGGRLHVMEYSLEEFAEVLNKGYMIKHIFDGREIARDAHKIIPPRQNMGWMWFVYKDLVCGKVTVPTLQRNDTVKYCRFQCVFFDIDKCEFSNYEDVLSHLDLLPNIIYQTFSYTEESPRYRLVYILGTEVESVKYEVVYDTIKRKLGGYFKFDDCCRKPTQTIYTTFGKEVVIANEYYYYYDEVGDGMSDLLSCTLLDESKNYSFKDIFNDCEAFDSCSYWENLKSPERTVSYLEKWNHSTRPYNGTMEDYCPKTFGFFGTQNVAQDRYVSVEDINISRRIDEMLCQHVKPSMYLERSFFQYAVTHTMKEVLHYFAPTTANDAYKCTEVEFETPNDIRQKFIFNKNGLLCLPHFYGRGQKLVYRDARKRKIGAIATLLLMMCNDITPEDLVYNVFRWCDKHISFNPLDNQHILNNKLIINLVKSEYDAFHAINRSYKYQKFLNEIEVKSRRKNYKKAVNAYYCGLHVEDNSYYYHTFCNKFQNEQVKSVSKDALRYELRNIKMERSKSDKTRSDKGQSHKRSSVSMTARCLSLLERGYSEKEIQDAVGVKRKYLKQIIRTNNQIKKAS